MNKNNQIKSVLLVDDEPATNYFHRKLLESAKFAVDIQVAESGFEALDFLQDCIRGKTETPEVIFLDLNMPGMDGWECVEKFEKMFPTTQVIPKIVVVTTSIHPDDEHKANQSGPIFAFYRKPLTEDNLATIARNLDDHQG